MIVFTNQLMSLGVWTLDCHLWWFSVVLQPLSDDNQSVILICTVPIDQSSDDEIFGGQTLRFLIYIRLGLHEGGNIGPGLKSRTLLQLNHAELRSLVDMIV
jgi:hypothetical protein